MDDNAQDRHATGPALDALRDVVLASRRGLAAACARARRVLASPAGQRQLAAPECRGMGLMACQRLGACMRKTPGRSAKGAVALLHQQLLPVLDDRTSDVPRAAVLLYEKVFPAAHDKWLTPSGMGAGNAPADTYRMALEELARDARTRHCAAIEMASVLMHPRVFNDRVAPAGWRMLLAQEFRMALQEAMDDTGEPRMWAAGYVVAGAREADVQAAWIAAVCLGWTASNFWRDPRRGQDVDKRLGRWIEGPAFEGIGHEALVRLDRAALYRAARSFEPVSPMMYGGTREALLDEVLSLAQAKVAATHLTAATAREDAMYTATRRRARP